MTYYITIYNNNVVALRTYFTTLAQELKDIKSFEDSLLVLQIN